VSDHLVIGGQLGNYLIDSVIGRGGMSVVYRAKHSRLGMSVALKVLAPELSSDDTFRERFLREAQMAAAVDHPNVIPIHDMGLHESSLYIVMRYVSGGDLKALLTTSSSLEAERALTLLMPIALALDAAHAHGLIHRDVKPANILIQRSAAGDVDHVYLTDFGIAKSASFMSGLTGTGGFIGTVEYMAPEQIEGHEVSAQTDVYALAATFYECLTGRIPFQRELAAGARPPTGAPEPVTGTRPELPSALDGVIAKGLSRNPFDRYATCEQFLRACIYVLEGRSSDIGDLGQTAIAATALSADESAGAGSQLSPDDAGSAREPVVAHAAGSTPSAGQPPPGGEQPRPVSRAPDRRGVGDRLAERRWYVAVLVALVAGAAVVVVLASGSTTPKGRLSSSALQQVPTNHVTGSGDATIRLNGDVASVTVTTKGLDNGAQLVHAMHIHGGGKGVCPPASAARLHNGHLAISTTDGINYYGPPVQALTTRGDTSVSSILAFPRYLTGGTLHYSRTITLPPKVAAYIRENNAVIVVHGIDYDGSGIYSGVLDTSELNKNVPGTATAPALCGHLSGPSTVAALNSSSRGHTLVYTASLASPAAQSGPARELLFLCHAPEATAAVTETRRRSSTKAEAPSQLSRA
jgi:serine/threonine protein kinase